MCTLAMFAQEAAKVLEYVPLTAHIPSLLLIINVAVPVGVDRSNCHCAFLLIVIMRIVDLVALLDVCMGNCVHSKLALNFQVIYLSGSRGMRVVKHPLHFGPKLNRSVCFQN